MDAAGWTAIGLVAAFSFGSLYYLGSRIDAQGASLGARIDDLGGRMDSMGTSLGARIDTHLDRHAG